MSVNHNLVLKRPSVTRKIENGKVHKTDVGDKNVLTERAIQIRDLNAQEVMANSAYWMLVVSLAATLFSVATLFLIWRTLYHTKRAADYTSQSVIEAEKSVGAAIKAADAAQESYKSIYKYNNIQLRAYVGPKAVNYTLNLETGMFVVVAEIANFGQTPAYKFRTLAALNFTSFPVESLPDPGQPFGETHTLYPTMETAVVAMLPASPEFLVRLRRGTGCYFFTLTCEFEDFSGAKYLEIHRLFVALTSPNIQPNNTHTATMTFHSASSFGGTI